MILVVGILAVTALLSGQLTAYMAVRSRGTASARAMAFTMGATAWWAAGNALEYLVPDFPAKLVFANLEYIAIAAIPVLWLTLGLSLDREERGSAPGRPTRVVKRSTQRAEASWPVFRRRSLRTARARRAKSGAVPKSPACPAMPPMAWALLS